MCDKCLKSIRRSWRLCEIYCNLMEFVVERSIYVLRRLLKYLLNIIPNPIKTKFVIHRTLRNENLTRKYANQHYSFGRWDNEIFKWTWILLFKKVNRLCGNSGTGGTPQMITILKRPKLLIVFHLSRQRKRAQTHPLEADPSSTMLVLLKAS